MVGLVSEATRRRTVVFSQRELSSQPWRCCGFEFEDVVLDLESSDLLTPRHGGLSAAIPRFVDHATRRASFVSLLNPAMPRVHVSPDADLLLMVVQFARDLSSLNSVAGWRRHGGRRVVVLEEIWPSFVRANWRQLAPLKAFDHIFIECRSSVELVAEATGVPTSYLPPGVDSLRFAPASMDADRPIDVCAIGRRSPVTHAALVDAAENNDVFYYWDSIRASGVWSVAEHRVRLAGLIKRSKYFLVNSAKFNEGPEVEEVGFRFFEGIAGGAALLGTAPDTPTFRSLFDWPDAVIDLPLHSEEIVDLIEELESQPDRMRVVRSRNVAMAMRRHDWVHRWEQVLDSVDLQLSDAAISRREELERRSDAILAAIGAHDEYAAQSTVL